MSRHFVILLAPVLVAYVVRVAVDWGHLSVTSLNGVLLIIPLLASSGVLIICVFALLDAGTVDLDDLAWVSSGLIAFFGTLTCGSYAVLFVNDLAGLLAGAVCASLLIMVIFHCLGSTFYRKRVANNPFNALLMGVQAFNGRASIRRRLSNRG